MFDWLFGGGKHFPDKLDLMIADIEARTELILAQRRAEGSGSCCAGDDIIQWCWVCEKRQWHRWKNTCYLRCDICDRPAAMRG